MNRSGILIVSHTFPPAPGIGGRRWAKFAKYIHARKIPVHVLSAFSEKQGSLWASDVNGISQQHWTHKFPMELDLSPTSLYAKLKYRAALLKNKRIAQGNPYDRSLYDRDSFLPAIEKELGKANVDTVVISAPPFGLLHYASALIEKYPKLFWIADLRDPWTSGVNYGYNLLKGKRASYELNAEREAIRTFHAVTTPWPLLVEELCEKYPDDAHKIHLLPHAFEREDVGLQSAPMKNALPQLAYGGNTYSGFEKVFAKLHQLAALNRMVAHIYTESPPLNIANESVDGFFWHSPVPPREFYSNIRSSDFLIFLIPEALRNGLPTKLYEYAATGIPLIAVGFKGTLQALIEREGLGYFVDLHSFEGDVESILTSGNRPTPAEGWVDQYEISRVTDALLGIIEKGKL